MDLSNWINLGILIVTAGLGTLSWWSARQSAREARADQEAAASAASRSALAAEEVALLQARIVAMESQRHEEAAFEARRARLHAEGTTTPVDRHGRPDREKLLTIINSGQATARRLEIRVEGRALGTYNEFYGGLPADASIGPGGHLDLPYVLFRNGDLRVPFSVALAWDDDSEMRGEWSGSVT